MSKSRQFVHLKKPPLWTFMFIQFLLLKVKKLFVTVLQKHSSFLFAFCQVKN